MDLFEAYKCIIDKLQEKHKVGTFLVEIDDCIEVTFEADCGYNEDAIPQVKGYRRWFESIGNHLVVSYAPNS